MDDPLPLLSPRADGGDIVQAAYFQAGACLLFVVTDGTGGEPRADGLLEGSGIRFVGISLGRKRYAYSQNQN